MVLPLRDENPTKTFPIFTGLLIFINIAIFLYEISIGNNLTQFIMEYGLIPADIGNLQSMYSLSPFISSIFIHGGFLHVAFNMLYLWIFGNNIEDYLGHFKFILFYLFCGICGSVAHILSNPLSQIPTIGASGAIAGVLGAYIILFPKARIITLVPLFIFIQIMNLPAFLVIGLWFILQIFSGFASITSGVYQNTGGTAWFAHIGGFLAGLSFIIAFYRKKMPRSRFH